MKPKTKRFLAKEWLIFWSIYIALWLCFSVTSVEYSHAYDEFWVQTETGRRVCDDPNRLAIAVPPHKRDPFTEFGGKEINPDPNTKKEMSKQWSTYVQTFPLMIRCQASVYGMVVGIFNGLFTHWIEATALSLAVYLFLWLPRLTVRAVQTLRKKPESTE